MSISVFPRSIRRSFGRQFSIIVPEILSAISSFYSFQFQNLLINIAYRAGERRWHLNGDVIRGFLLRLSVFSSLMGNLSGEFLLVVILEVADDNWDRQSDC